MVTAAPDPNRDIDEDAKTDPPPASPWADPVIPFYAGQAINWSVRYR